MDLLRKDNTAPVSRKQRPTRGPADPVVGRASGGYPALSAGKENRMTSAAIEIRKLTPHCGATILGVDLSAPLDDAIFTAIHDALVDHGVIFFRDQRMTPDQQKAFARRFGELHFHPAYPYLLEGHPEIMVIYGDEKSKRVAGEHWHSDV